MSTVLEESIKAYYSSEVVLRHYAKATVNLGLWQSEEILIRQYFRPTDTLLDLGTGSGRIALALWEIGYRKVMGVDLSPAMIEEARRFNVLLEYGVPFQAMDATQLDFGGAVFDGIIFGFNGLMQIPGRAKRRLALRKIGDNLRPGGYFMFTTHDRNQPFERDFWREEKERWETQGPPAGVTEFGDRFEPTELGQLFIHVPDREEILQDLADTGWTWVEDRLRHEIANESAEVRQFSDECRFWVAKRPPLP